MLNQLNIGELTAKLAQREVSAREITEACLNQISRQDGKIHAFLSYDAGDALAQADAADQIISRQGLDGSRPLLGIPVAIKDVLAVKNQPLNCASKILGNFKSPYDATAIEKLRAAGAIVFGRLNMDEFAMGSSTENSAFGVTRNPWDTTRIPGGSSGGSAAAVAADECIARVSALTPAAPSDSRLPFVVVWGLNPRMGRISRYGLVAFASSPRPDRPPTKNVSDAGRAAWCSEWPRPARFHQHSGTGAGLHPGSDRRHQRFETRPAPRVSRADAGWSWTAGLICRGRSRKKFSELGAEIVEISLPHTDLAPSPPITSSPRRKPRPTSPASTGFVMEHAWTAMIPWSLQSHARRRLRPEVKRRIILGTYVLSSGYYEAYYLRAQKVRTLIRNDFLRAFETVDAILTPTTPTAAFKIGEKSEDPLQMYLSDIFTISCNLAGICGISVPCGFTQNPRLPIGLQILGKPLGEATMLRLAHAYEQSTGWHRQKAPL